MIIPDFIKFHHKDDKSKVITWDGLPLPGFDNINFGSLNEGDDPAEGALVLIDLDEDETHFAVINENKEVVFEDALSNYTCWKAVVQAALRNSLTNIL